MRYDDNEVLDFSNVFGEERKIKQVHESVVSTSKITVPKPPEADFDLMMATNFGPGQEEGTYILRDLNIAELLDHNFDESKMKRIRIE